MIRLLACLCLLLAALSGQASAHDLRPAYFAIVESEPGIYAIHWKAPAMGDSRLAVYPRLPASAVELAPHDAAIMNDAYVERWKVREPAGFAGETIAMDGLAETRTDVLLRIERLSGEVVSARLTSAAPSYLVPAETGWQQVATTYVGLGVEHIVFGIDHLLFVFALIMLAGGWKRIALTITAFTAAHSITLAAATLGYIHVPGPPVEAAIALSIALVAVEVLRVGRGEPSLTMRFPWLVAFAFGLLHGLGFAGALSEVGLPAHAIPVALLFFNVGVELGQLAFTAAVLASFALLGPFVGAIFRSRGNAPFIWARVAGAYAIGGTASLWLIERVGGFWA